MEKLLPQSLQMICFISNHSNPMYLNIFLPSNIFLVLHTNAYVKQAVNRNVSSHFQIHTSTPANSIAFDANIITMMWEKYIPKLQSPILLRMLGLHSLMCCDNHKAMSDELIKDENLICYMQILPCNRCSLTDKLTYTSYYLPVLLFFLCPPFLLALLKGQQYTIIRTRFFTYSYHLKDCLYGIFRKRYYFL